MGLSFNLWGFLVAAGIELLFLVILGRAAGAGVAVILAVFVVAFIDFMWMRSMSIFLGNLFGFLSVTGVWYLLILIGVVH